MAAAAGATGARSWLQAHHATWLTPRRLKAATVTIMVGAFGVASLGLSGSTPSRHQAQGSVVVRAR